MAKRYKKHVLGRAENLKDNLFNKKPMCCVKMPPLASVHQCNPVNSSGSESWLLSYEIPRILLSQIDGVSENMQTIDIQIAEEKVAIYRDIKESEAKLDDLRKLFQEIIKSALFLSEEHEVSAYFDVSTTTNRRRDQLPFSVNIEVPKSDALGRFNLKLVAYDLLVFLHAVRTQRQLPRFLVHDGVFHGISKRTMIDTLNFIHRQSQMYPGFQYIVTFNEDEIYIPEERKELDGTLTFDLEKVLIARYTDSELGMIFKKAFG